MVAELYDALLSAGAPEDKARAAAEALSNYDGRFDAVERRIDAVENSLSQRIDAVENALSRRIDAVESTLSRRIDAVESSLSRRIDAVEGRVNLLTWMVGTNITLTLLVIGKLFLVPGH